MQNKISTVLLSTFLQIAESFKENTQIGSIVIFHQYSERLIRGHLENKRDSQTGYEKIKWMLLVLIRQECFWHV